MGFITVHPILIVDSLGTTVLMEKVRKRRILILLREIIRMD